jgi:hypothetical protein
MSGMGAGPRTGGAGPWTDVRECAGAASTFGGPFDSGLGGASEGSGERFMENRRANAAVFDGTEAAAEDSDADEATKGAAGVELWPVAGPAADVAGTSAAKAGVRSSPAATPRATAARRRDARLNGEGALIESACGETFRVVV